MCFMLFYGVSWIMLCLHFIYCIYSYIVRFSYFFFALFGVFIFVFLFSRQSWKRIPFCVFRKYALIWEARACIVLISVCSEWGSSTCKSFKWIEPNWKQQRKSKHNQSKQRKTKSQPTAAMPVNSSCARISFRLLLLVVLLFHSNLTPFLLHIHSILRRLLKFINRNQLWTRTRYNALQKKSHRKI